MGRGPSKKLAKRPRAAARGDQEEGDGKEVKEEEEDEALLFPVGAEVEVGSDDPGFVGSFYEGTVEAHLPGGDGYVVAYTTLEEGGAALREEARARDVRPQPPPVAGAPAPVGSRCTTWWRRSTTRGGGRAWSPACRCRWTCSPSTHAGGCTRWRSRRRGR